MEPHKGKLPFPGKEVGKTLVCTTRLGQEEVLSEVLLLNLDL